MIEYESREEAEKCQDLNLMIVWKCDKCGNEREDRPNWNVGGNCECSGIWQQVGESYNSL